MSEIFLPQTPRRDDPQHGYLTVQANVEYLARLFNPGTASGQVPVWDNTLGRFVTGAVPGIPLTHDVVETYRATNQAMTGAAWNAIAFDNESSDEGNWHDNATNNTRITNPYGVPVWVMASCWIAPNGQSGTALNDLRFEQYNSSAVALGVIHQIGHAVLNGFLTLSCTAFKLAVGDFFQAEYFPNPTGTPGNVGTAKLSAVRIK